MDESTLSGVLGERRVEWASQLLMELLERALALGRWEDALRVVNRAMRSFDERVEQEGMVEIEQFDHLLEGVSKVAQAQQDSKLVEWALMRCVRHRHVPSSDVLKRLAAVSVQDRATVRKLVDELTVLAASRKAGAQSLDVLVRWRKHLS